MMQKYLTLTKNILVLLIIINLQIKLTDEKIKWNELVKKADVSGFINNSNLDNKIATVAAKKELKAQQDKMFKLQVLD